jgi:hypothetical protein
MLYSHTMAAPIGIRFSRGRRVYFHVEEANVLEYSCDLMVLKYAQALHGADRAAVAALRPSMPHITEDLPKVGDFKFIKTSGKLGSAQVLLIGVPPIRDFGYRQMRDFGRTVLSVLRDHLPAVSHVALTVHGPERGLDELECFDSLLAGLLDALFAGETPPTLSDLAIVERVRRRVKRFDEALDRIIRNRTLEIDPSGNLTLELEPAATQRIRAAGYASEAKPLVFVAMPFRDDMRDHYDYGILNAAEKAGFLCERADDASFTGDILQWVKNRIDVAKVVVADLSYMNPNVYLELGYAWGRNKPTILLVNDGDALPFDVQGQRCLIYKRIKDIEITLAKELAAIDTR